jgi:hypothetical protein
MSLVIRYLPKNRFEALPSSASEHSFLLSDQFNCHQVAVHPKIPATPLFEAHISEFGDSTQSKPVARLFWRILLRKLFA